MKRRGIVFLDRDGTLNRDINFPYKAEHLELLPGVIEGLKMLRDEGFIFIVITNQSGIGRGLFTEEDMHTFNNALLNILRKEGIEIKKIFFCPHKPEDGCICRKPSPYFIHMAIEEFNIKKENCYIIGDRVEDGMMGKIAGVKSVLVKTGPKIPSDEEKEKFFDFVCENFEEASRKILEDWRK